MLSLDISRSHLKKMSGIVDVFEMSLPPILELLKHLKESFSLFTIFLGDLDTLRHSLLTVSFLLASLVVFAASCSS